MSLENNVACLSCWVELWGYLPSLKPQKLVFDMKCIKFVYYRQANALWCNIYHKYSHCGFVLFSMEAGITVKAMLVYVICYIW